MEENQRENIKIVYEFMDLLRFFISVVCDRKIFYVIQKTLLF